MNHYPKSISFLLAAIISMASCHSVKFATPDNTRPMPVTYGRSADTSSMVLQSWQSMFADTLLIELIDTALANNQDMLIALQRIRKSQASVLLSKGAMKPEVRTIAAASLNKYGAYTMDGAGNMTTPIYDGRMVPDHLPDYYLGLQATWEIDIWGKLRSRRKAAMARFLASIEGKNLVVTRLVSEVSIGYYELMALDTQLAIIDETIQLQANALEIVKVQKDAGVTNELAVQQFEAQLNGLKSMRLELYMQIKERENSMNLLLGRYPQPIKRSNMAMAGGLLHKVAVGIPASLLQNRPDIRQAEAELMATVSDINAAKAAFYPSLTINAGTGVEAFKTSLLFTTPQSIVYNLIGGFAAPLINRSALKSDLYIADAEKTEALLQYQKLMIKAYAEVYTEMQRIDNLEQVYDFKTKQVTILSNAIETSSELFKTGRSSYLEVLVTQQNALNSRLERVDVRSKQLYATVNIYKALGGGWR